MFHAIIQVAADMPHETHIKHINMFHASFVFPLQASLLSLFSNLLMSFSTCSSSLCRSFGHFLSLWQHWISSFEGSSSPPPGKRKDPARQGWVKKNPGGQLFFFATFQLLEVIGLSSSCWQLKYTNKVSLSRVNVEKWDYKKSHKCQYKRPHTNNKFDTK